MLGRNLGGGSKQLKVKMKPGTTNRGPGLHTKDAYLLGITTLGGGVCGGGPGSEAHEVSASPLRAARTATILAIFISEVMCNSDLS